MIPTALAERPTPPGVELSDTSVPEDFGLELFGQPTPVQNSLYVHLRIVEPAHVPTTLDLVVSIVTPGNGGRLEAKAVINYGNGQVFARFDMSYELTLECAAHVSALDVRLTAVARPPAPVSTTPSWRIP